MIWVGDQKLTIPTEAEILRIKGFLLLRRNATRDYVDFAALARRLGETLTATAFERFDRLYPQDSGESALQQMLAQLSSPLPYDLEGTVLSEYNHLEARWHDWEAICTVCGRAATVIFDHGCEQWEESDGLHWTVGREAAHQISFLSVKPASPRAPQPVGPDCQ